MLIKWVLIKKILVYVVTAVNANFYQVPIRSSKDLALVPQASLQ